MPQPFERDLGYLDRFLEKVLAHAAELADRAQGERLAALIDDEVSRWAEIRGLLAGGAGDAARAEEPREAGVGVARADAGAQQAAGAEEGAGSGAPPTDLAHGPASGPSPEEVPELLAPEPTRRETPVGPTSWEPRRRARRAAGDARTREAHLGRRWTVGPLRPR